MRTFKVTTDTTYAENHNLRRRFKNIQAEDVEITDGVLILRQPDGNLIAFNRDNWQRVRTVDAAGSV